MLRFTNTAAFENRCIRPGFVVGGTDLLALPHDEGDNPFVIDEIYRSAPRYLGIDALFVKRNADGAGRDCGSGG